MNIFNIIIIEKVLLKASLINTTPLALTRTEAFLMLLSAPVLFLLRHVKMSAFK